MNKICSKCGKEKPIEQFYHLSNSKDGHRPDCKKCENVKATRKTPEQRFWKHVQVSNQNECWTWKAGTATNNGYGRLWIGRDGKTHEVAHRFVWKITNGDIPAGLEVCHKCDNPKCVNPNHLFLGTHSDNMQDMVSKGRMRGFNE